MICFYRKLFNIFISRKKNIKNEISKVFENYFQGLAVGVGFGSVGKSPKSTFESAFNLALGIGLQNFPEGLAVSLPLAAFGHSKFKVFFS